MVKRQSIGEQLTPFETNRQMHATTSASSGFRYKSVTQNAIVTSAASGTRNQPGGGSPDTRALMMTPLGHSTAGSQRAAALNLSVDQAPTTTTKLNFQDNPSLQTIMRVKMGFPQHASQSAVKGGVNPSHTQLDWAEVTRFH